LGEEKQAGEQKMAWNGTQEDRWIRVDVEDEESQRFAWTIDVQTV
jgi:hypothetical protein